jgi:hypothetical protein
MFNYASTFNNYPHQIDYEFPSANLGFFRTSGIFNESSQYASFLALYVILYIEGYIAKSKFSSVVLLLSIVDIFANQSITSFLIVFAYLIYKIAIKERGGIKAKIILGFSLLVAVGIFPEIIEKIYLTIYGQDESYPRFLNAYKKVNNVFSGNVFTGNGLSWDDPTWDFISVYLTGYGLIGLLVFVIFVYSVVHSVSPPLLIALFIFMITNGNILVSMNILMLSFMYAQKYHGKNI